MRSSHLLRVAVLVDLPRSPQSGGHVKCWERLAAAAAHGPLPIDLTVYFSGKERTEILSPHVRIRQLPPIFSTAYLKFLPYVPDHTDLAPYHPRLARELSQYDVIHTTDGFFAFARTAEKVSRRHNIPLVTSFHTDTPSYTRIFTRQTIEKLCARVPTMRKKLLEDWNMPERQGRIMDKKLRDHVQTCQYALVTRAEDHILAEGLIGQERVHHLRLGVDKAMFHPHKRDRDSIESEYGIPPHRIVVLFVGRIDVGKNIYILIGAIEKLIKEGVPLHLITAGLGPAVDDVKERLAGHASVPGFVAPEEIARLYASVDALAISSEVEIRSMAAVEAMAAGCPVLVSRKSGIAELFGHTPAMFEVDSDVEHWAEALRGLASNAAQRKQMQEAASLYSREHLASWQDVLAEDLFTVWKKVCANKQCQAA